MTKTTTKLTAACLGLTIGLLGLNLLELNSSASAQEATASEKQKLEATAENAPAAVEGDWGSFTGQIIVDGEPPKMDPLAVGNHADKAVCLDENGEVPLDDDILVGENGGLKDVLVFMVVGRGEEPPKAHPDYQKEPAESLKIDNVKCRFQPKVLSVRPGQSVELKNSDSVGHNCHITTFNNEHNINLPPNSSVDLVLENNDTSPGKVVCDVHPWMDAVIFVSENPYVAITDADGKFTLKNVPAGKFSFKFWHVKTGWQKDLVVKDMEVSRRGQIDLNIESGKTLDLGKMSLPAKAFK
jgi:plastocyanin